MIARVDRFATAMWINSPQMKRSWFLFHQWPLSSKKAGSTLRYSPLMHLFVPINRSGSASTTLPSTSFTTLFCFSISFYCGGNFHHLPLRGVYRHCFAVVGKGCSRIVDINNDLQLIDSPTPPLSSQSTVAKRKRNFPHQNPIIRNNFQNSLKVLTLCSVLFFFRRYREGVKRWVIHTIS